MTYKTEVSGSDIVVMLINKSVQDEKMQKENILWRNGFVLKIFHKIKIISKHLDSGK